MGDMPGAMHAPGGVAQPMLALPPQPAAVAGAGPHVMDGDGMDAAPAPAAAGAMVRHQGAHGEAAAAPPAAAGGIAAAGNAQAAAAAAAAAAALGMQRQRQRDATVRRGRMHSMHALSTHPPTFGLCKGQCGHI